MGASSRTAAMTPAMAGADLLDELRQLLRRHDGASSLDEVRALLDELTTTVRRGRGRMRRFAKPAAEPNKADAAPKPGPAAEAKATEAEQKPAAPAKPPAPQRADVRIPDEPEPQQERPPELPPEAPEVPPLPPPGPRSWSAWIAAALLTVLAVFDAVAVWVHPRAVCWSRRAMLTCRSATRRVRAAWRSIWGTS